MCARDDTLYTVTTPLDIGVFFCYYTFVFEIHSMFLSETFGRFFWIDDDLEFRSCGAFVDGTGDFDNSDYVSEWEDWEGVDYNELFNIHKAELINKLDYAGSLSINGKHLVER